MAPHVNAYKRLQPDMLNGYWATWGHDDRSVTVRVPPARGARHAPRAAHRRRRRQPVPRGRRGAATRRGSGWRTSWSSRRSSPTGEDAELRRVHPADPRRGARRAQRRRASGRGARPGGRRGLHDLEARRMGALRRGHGRHRRRPRSRTGSCATTCRTTERAALRLRWIAVKILRYRTTRGLHEWGTRRHRPGRSRQLRRGRSLRLVRPAAGRGARRLASGGGAQRRLLGGHPLRRPHRRAHGLADLLVGGRRGLAGGARRRTDRDPQVDAGDGPPSAH